jgi:hypothetical protein
MANWYGLTRSNYVRVKDPETFKKYVECFSMATLIEKTLVDEETKEETPVFGFYEYEEGYLPQIWLDDPEEDEEALETVNTLKSLGIDSTEHIKDSLPINISDFIHLFLAEGEVMVIQQAGSEKARYASGYSWAIHSSGEDIFIDLDDIYKKVKRKWNTKPLPCGY